MQSASRDEQLRIRAYYLWESEGRPEGRAEEFWTRAIRMLDHEATLVTPIDEATAAGSLLTGNGAGEAPKKPRKKAATAEPKATGGAGEVKKEKKAKPEKAEKAVKPAAAKKVKASEMKAGAATEEAKPAAKARVAKPKAASKAASETK